MLVADFSPRMASLLRSIAKDVVVVGGAARVANGEQGSTKDLDLLLNPSDAAVARTRQLIRESGLQFTSPAPESWTFPDEVAGTQVEISTWFAGPSYRSRVKSADRIHVGGISLRVAQE